METQAAIAIANPALHDHAHWTTHLRDMPVARRVMLEVGMRACLRLLEYVPSTERPKAAIALAAVQDGINAGVVPYFPRGIPQWPTNYGAAQYQQIHAAYAAITGFCRFAALAPAAEPVSRTCLAQFLTAMGAAIECEAHAPENRLCAAPAAAPIDRQRMDCLAALREITE